ncbi:hypothetical protein DAPPUDRAFT_320590 [Daphnia pulex]|uniref:Uncharacterized protein n=1 Tax=Daphnia pulex TaxID=6669 RepID=E9GQJ8_DAPPU|nr:hypothetical protein DAPPUDRAFT_320590 [Daphnia pulex]|eukprot:EFX78316.1 hypothetical protein DAPPUDRAFT_320590 [Daphnia pulex]
MTTPSPEVPKVPHGMNPWVLGALSALLQIPLPENLDRQLDRYLIAIRQKRDATGLVCLAIALQLIENREKLPGLAIRADSPDQPQFNLPPVGNTPEITVEFNAAAIEAIPAAYGVHQKRFYSSVLQAYPVAWKWIVQLTACYQVHPLQANDVANYFKQFRDFLKITSFNGQEVNGNAVLPYIKFVTSTMKWPHSDFSKKIVANDEIRAAFLSDSSFVKRRTTFSATAGLCRQLIDGLGSHVSEFQINDKMIEAVDRSLAIYWDPELNGKIPVQLIAMAAAYAEFQGRDYGNWIQGKRALSKTRPILVGAWKRMFESLL